MLTLLVNEYIFRKMSASSFITKSGLLTIVVKKKIKVIQVPFPEIISVLLKCLPRPRLGVLHVPLVISGLENTRDLIEINLKKDNCVY